jgi:hypothetical protein
LDISYAKTIVKLQRAKYATKRDLFALAVSALRQHMSPCLAGILSQNFQGPVGNDRALFSLACRDRPGSFVPVAGLQCAQRVPSSIFRQIAKGWRSGWLKTMQASWKREPQDCR